MSTRATYQFIDSNDKVTTTYVHHDGYPEGAATKIFGGTLDRAFKRTKNMTAKSFMRKNGRAEITESHEIHGDTEYRYTMYKQCIVGQQIARNGKEYTLDREFETFFEGTIQEFIDKYAPAEWKELILKGEEV